MPVIKVITEILAPADVCFDGARHIDLHVRTAAATGERAVGGVTRGCIGPGEEVTWEATHLGIRLRLTSRITAFDRPFHFRDSQVRGIFEYFDHDHWFEPIASGTRMLDVFAYASPFGLLGRIADRVVVERHMQDFLTARAAILKREIEAGWVPGRYES